MIWRLTSAWTAFLDKPRVGGHLALVSTHGWWWL